MLIPRLFYYYFSSNLVLNQVLVLSYINDAVEKTGVEIQNGMHSLLHGIASSPL